MFLFFIFMDEELSIDFCLVCIETKTKLRISDVKQLEGSVRRFVRLINSVISCFA